VIGNFSVVLDQKLVFPEQIEILLGFIWIYSNCRLSVSKKNFYVFATIKFPQQDNSVLRGYDIFTF